MTAPSQRPGYFDALYAANPDPWGFETRLYEAEKYLATIDSLPRPRFCNALEVGCSIGVLTEALAAHCDNLLGIDVAPAALAQAMNRCAKWHGVSFALSDLPAEAPPGPFDLIVLSEVLYYFDAGQLSTMARTLSTSMTSDAVVLLVHWLGETPDYPLDGDCAVTVFENELRHMKVLQRVRTDDFRIDVLERVRTG